MNDFHDLAMRTAAPADSFFPHDVMAEQFAHTLMTYIQAARDLDRLKSILIYGKAKDESKYDPLPVFHDHPPKWGNLTRDPGELVHAVLGVGSEGGELAEHLLWMLCGTPESLTRLGMVEETGDVDWFQELLAKWLDVPTTESQARVIKKLQARYPEKYSQEHAVARLDKTPFEKIEAGMKDAIAHAQGQTDRAVVHQKCN